ncbi:Lpg1974 family pore-forming outer membrane protein [Alteromonas sp. 14N.309.X.WAT.G.H12]|uniref:Lpg1974 family pore-forming outer membrane protein n=1 Tax=Alteromonas sp. 14N.309.X.WAT.G.H12 TaxID=3120824 RepID=UPI002FD52953
MKAIYNLAGLVAVSLSVSVAAKPYIAAGISYNTLEIEDNSYDFAEFDDGVTLDLSNDDTSSDVWLEVGYDFTPQWGIALRYTEFESGDEDEVAISALNDEEWDASLDVTEFTLEAVYHYPIGDDFTLSMSGGLALHHIDVSQSHELDVEDGEDVVYSSFSDSETKVGASLGLSLSYKIYDNLSLLAQTRYSYTSVISNASVGVGVAYAF